MRISVKTKNKQSLISITFKPFGAIDSTVEKRLVTDLSRIEGVDSVESHIQGADELHVNVTPATCDNVKNEIDELLLKIFNDRAVSLMY